MLNAKLYAASADGDLATVRDCLARGADVNFENEKVRNSQGFEHNF